LLAFASNARGAAAVEFALIALPLFVMIGGIMEMALVFLISINLQDASITMARKIRLGAYVAPGVSVTSSSGIQLDETDFKTDVCNMVQLVPATICKAQLQVDIRPFTSFSTTSVSAYNSVTGGVFNSSGLCYYSGAAGNIVVMRLYYLWPLFTPFLLNGLSNVTSYSSSAGAPSTGTWAEVTAPQVFVNEPNPNTSNTGNSC